MIQLSRRAPRNLVLILPLSLCPGTGMSQEPPASVNEQAVKERIARLTELLVDAQRPDGSWSQGGYPTGTTALVVLALKHAGLPNGHPAVRKSVQFILRRFEPRTYSESLVACALEQVDPQGFKKRLAKSVRFLSSAQARGGGWSYGRARSRSDNSNTQFAVLGLAAAERCGIEVPEAVKRRALDHWLRCQTRDGGWSYGSHRNSSYLAMTCAGIASLHLLGREYEKPRARCGDYEYDTRISRGLEAMLRQAGRPVSRFRSYSLYALERVGMFLDLKEVRGLEWYRWGAWQILSHGVGTDISDRALDLLFLAKGEAQIAIAKWQWNGDWNNDHGDVKNWVRLASDELQLKLDWLPVRLSESAVSAAKASLIFANGHGRFAATRAEALRVREFLGNRGTLVVEGCCGSQVLVESFKEFVRSQLYPRTHISFVKVTVDHPVCEQRYSLSPEEISAVQVRTGCHKPRILILTRDISCALSGEPCREGQFERARKLAINLLQWAMRSKAPKGKLAEVEVADETSEADGLGEDEPGLEPEMTRRHHQPFGRLIHRGEWNVDLALFATLRGATAGLDAVPDCDGEVFVRPASGDLFACAVIYITGHDDPKLRREEWLPLRRYLQNGGSIIATACCGFEEFDRGFRGLMRQVLPNDRLEVIAEDDAIWGAPYSRSSLEVDATRGYREKYGKNLAPLYGIRRAGRWIVLYSPVDLCCDLEGDLEEDTVSYKKSSALPIWSNLLYHIFTP